MLHPPEVCGEHLEDVGGGDLGVQLLPGARAQHPHAPNTPSGGNIHDHDKLAMKLLEHY